MSATKVYADAVETDWGALEKEIGKITTKQQISIKLSSDPNIELFVVVGDGGLYGYVMFDTERGQLYHFSEPSTTIEPLDTKTRSPDALLIRNYGGSHFYIECSKDGPSVVYKNIQVKSKQLMELDISSIWFPVERGPTTAIPFDPAKEAKKLKKIEQHRENKRFEAIINNVMNGNIEESIKIIEDILPLTGLSPGDSPSDKINALYNLLSGYDTSLDRVAFENRINAIVAFENEEELKSKVGPTKGSAVVDESIGDDKDDGGNESDLSDGW